MAILLAGHSKEAIAPNLLARKL
ncbi:MAG: hypothetical protein RL472_874, partial [Pseudomonadota bacterium]